MIKNVLLRKVKRQCFVPGCGNTTSYILTKNPECLAKVVICEECLKKAYLTLFPKSQKKQEANAHTAEAEETGKASEVKA